VITRAEQYSRILYRVSAVSIAVPRHEHQWHRAAQLLPIKTTSFSLLTDDSSKRRGCESSNGIYEEVRRLEATLSRRVSSGPPFLQGKRRIPKRVRPRWTVTPLIFICRLSDVYLARSPAKMLMIRIHHQVTGECVREGHIPR